MVAATSNAPESPYPGLGATPLPARLLARADARAPDSRPPAKVPGHIAIVMDGNGRWASRRARPRSFGHRAGQKAVRTAVGWCLKHGVPVLTLFAFSSENWRRPKAEVGALMELFLRALDREIDELHRHEVRVRFVGQLESFPEALRTRMQLAMIRTTDNARLALNICVGYGGRWDIAQAARRAAAAVARGEIDAAAIDEDTLAPYFCLSEFAPPDLLIRTGGERRVSNFLLWQLAYTELYFTDTLWPDVDDAELDRALLDFAHRERRFGRTALVAVARTG